MKLFLLRTLISLLLFTGIATCTQAQAFGPGDIQFSGINIYDDNNNGSVQNDAFSFILLRNCPSNTKIYFTDLGWTGSGFQTMVPNCANGGGSGTDGVIEWSSGSGGYSAGTQIIIYCKYNPTCNKGSINISNCTPTGNTVGQIQAAKEYISLGFLGDQLFAFTGNINSPTIIAGINVNKAIWDLSLDGCDFTSSRSKKPATTPVMGFANANSLNAVYKCDSKVMTLANLRRSLLDMTKWTQDNTLLAPAPASVNLRSTPNCAITIVNPSADSILYVDKQKNISGSGNSWADPLYDLSTALTAAADTGNHIKQIWIGKSTYKPTNIAGPSASFVIPSNVAVYGGFAGNETTLGQRNIAANPVILSGDIGGDDHLTNNITQKFSDIVGQNNYHVITLNNISQQTLIDGVIITGGTANGGSLADRSGAGISNYGNLTIANTQFYGNDALLDGAGMYNNYGTVSLTNCVFYGNRSSRNGGAIMNTAFVDMRLTNVTIGGNTSQASAVVSDRSSFATYNSIISGNNSVTAANDVAFTNTTQNINYSILGDQYYTNTNTHKTTPAVQFANPTTGDLRLLPVNYGINKGDSSTNKPNYAAQAGTSDLDGKPRISNTVIDLGAYEIQAIPQTITFSQPAPVTYGMQNIDPLATTSGDTTVTYTTDNIAVADTLNGKIKTTGAGTVVITAYAAATNTYLPATPVSKTLTVNKKALTITVNDTTRVYKGLNPSVTYTYAGFAYADSAAMVTGVTATHTANSNSITGTYPVTINLSGATAANYLLTGVNGTLTVTPQPQTITFPAPATVTYGVSPLTLPEFTDAGVAIVYTVDAGPATVAGNILTITGAGNVTVTASQPGDHDHIAATPVTQIFTVNKATLAVTANDKNKAYKQANPTLDYNFTGFVNGEDKSVVSNTADITTTADSDSHPGVYPITVAIGTLGAANYDFTFHAGSLTVAKAAQVITVPTITTKTYGNTPFGLAGTSTSGLPITYSATGPVSITDSIVTITGAGSVTITANQSNTTDYDAATTVVTGFTILKAPLIVRADSKQRLYGQNNPTLTYTYDGLVYTDDNSAVSGTPALSTTANLNSVPANYPITITNFASLTAANYLLSQVNGNLAVQMAPQTITFPAISNKTYGDAPVILNASSDGGLTIAYTVTAGPATVTGNTLTITGVGTVTVTANQAGDGNYTPATQATQSFNIDKASLMVLAAPASKTYLQPNPTLTYTISGFVNGDNISAVNGDAAISTTADLNSTPGKYAIIVSAGGLTASNYTFGFTGDSLTVTPAGQLISFPAISGKTYGDAPITLNASSDANLTVAYAVTSGPATITGNSLTITGIGSITVTATQAGNGNYTAATPVSNTFQVAPAILTVKADDVSKAYGDNNPTFTSTITGFVNSENTSVITGNPVLSSSADNSSIPGTYPITVATTAMSAANYTFTTTDGTLTVGKAAQTISFPAISGKTYGDAPVTLNASSDAGLPVTYTITSGPATITGNTLTITGAGSVTVTATQTGNSNYDAATPASSTFQVAPATLTVKADNAQRAYGINNPAFTYSVTGFVNSENTSVITGNPILSSVADNSSAPGAYPITVSTTGMTAANYIFTTANGILTVDQAAQTISFPAISGKTYGDAPITLNASSDANLTVAYAVTSGPATITGNTLTITGVGSITVTATQAGNGNYTAAAPASITFQVAPAILTVKADDVSKAYGDNNPTFTSTITSFVNSEDAGVITGNPVLSSSADNSSIPGTYPITVVITAMSAANYTFTTINGTLTVGKAAQTISFPAISGKTYGDAPVTLNANSDAGLPVTYIVTSGPATITGNTLIITGIGSVTVTATQTGNSNYNPATPASNTFQVAPATLIVKADNAQRAYGINNPTFTYSVTGFVNSENTSVITGNPILSSVADNSSVPGSYPITVATTGITAANYIFITANGILTVGKAAQTISFPAISGKTYGDAPITLNASSDANLTVAYAVTAGPATITGTTLTITGAGSITVTATQAGNSNYTAAAPASNTFQVAPAILTVKADDVSKAYGDNNPTFTSTITGFVNSEDASVITGNPVLSSSADNSSIPGTYPITVATTAMNAANYTFTTTDGTLTVGKAAQTISFPAISGKTYGDAPVTLNASSDAGLPVTYIVTSGPATITGNTLTITGIGSVTVTATQTGNSNYNAATPASNTFQVAPATLTVKADNAQRAYGINNPTFTYSVTGFVNSENTSVITGNPILSSVADNSSVPGSYPITVATTGITAANYIFTTANGILTVGKAAQTISSPAISGKTYGDAPVTLNASSDANLTVAYAVTSGPATITGNTLTITGVGSITVTATQAGNGNYTAATPVSNTFQVAPAILTVKADDVSKAYGDNNPTFTSTITGFVNSENTSVITGNPVLSSSADNSSIPGTYPITVATTAMSAANYTFTTTNGTLTVGKAAQTISFPAISGKTYGDAPVTLNTSSDAGLPVTYIVTSGPATITGNTLTITGIGSVTVTATQTGSSNYNAATPASNTFQVAPATLTVKADNAQRAYGTNNPTFTYSVTGFVNNENAGLITGNPILSSIADNSSVPGSYPITVATTAITAANYIFTTANGILTVGKAAQTISFPAISGKTYGDAPVTLNASSDAGLLIGYTVTSGPATIIGTTLTITGAGSIRVTATQAGNSNYTAAAPASITFQVAPAVLTVKIDDKQIVSGGIIPTFTYAISGYVNNDNSNVVRGAISFTTTAPNNTQTGTYPIQVLSTTLTADNYTFTTINGILTIGQQAQTISFPAISGKTYGDATFALNASSNSGLVITYSVVNGPATINGNIVTITGTGSVTITADQSGNANYKPATSATQTFMVSKAMLTVKADNAQRLYGASNPAFTYNITGFVNNENGSVVNGLPTLNSIADNNSAPGTYPITVVATTMTAANYTFTTTDGTLTIGKASQAISFPAITGKTYGDASFMLNASSNAGLPVTYTVTSGPATITGNTLTITGAGSVTVTASQTGNGNYTAATPVSNTFQVAAATLTVKADDMQRIYGTNNPAFTFTITGFVNNESASVVTGVPTLSSIADNNSMPGAYPITVATTALHAANYIFTTTNGTLIVGLATQTISFPAITNKTYGDAAFIAGASSNSNLAVIYSVISGPATINGNTITITGAGNITIAANQPGNSSYAPAAQVTQTFTVNKATLTMKASNDTRTYSGTVYTGGNGVAYTGFANGDDATKLSGSITYAGSAQGAINAGIYVITPAGVSSNNYNIIYTDGQLTIAKATQQITFTAPGDKNQGDPDFMLLATASSGLPVTLTSDNSTAISIIGSTAKVGTAGIAHISASQAGDNNYEPAQNTTQTVVVNAWPTPVITAQGSTTFCDGNTVILQSSTAPAYEWYRNNVLISATGSQTLTVKESGSYMVKARYDNNVLVSSVVVNITVHPLPAGSVRAQGNTTISKGETITLLASGGNSYLWDPAAGLNDPPTATPAARPEVTTTYHVTITNNNGCSVTEEITITVKEDYKLEATNILTPNGDGKNDLWVVKNIDMYPQNEVKIFDRAGRMVFHQRGYTNNWNGTVNGQRLAEGTYYYIIDLGNNKPQFKGFITLINSNY